MVKRNVWVPLYIESWQWKGMFESHYTSVYVLQTSAQAAWVSSPGTRGATMASRGQNTLSLTPLWVSHQVLFLTAVMLQVGHPVHTICLRAITGHVTNTLMFWPSGCQTQSSDNTNVEILMKDASSWLIRYMSVEILIRTGVCGWLVNMLYPCWNIDNVMRACSLLTENKNDVCIIVCVWLTVGDASAVYILGFSAARSTTLHGWQGFYCWTLCQDPRQARSVGVQSFFSPKKTFLFNIVWFCWKRESDFGFFVCSYNLDDVSTNFTKENLILELLHECIRAHAFKLLFNI